MTPAHDFTALGDGVYRLDVPDLGISFALDRLRRKNGELIGELTVTCDLAGAKRITDDGIISAADVNLSSVRARQDRASLLAKRAQTGDQVDWYSSIEYLAHRVIQAERTGAPSVLLPDVALPATEVVWTWHNLTVLQREAQIWFGDGGTGKSLLALALAGDLVRRGVATLYVDWETTASDHRDRLGRLFADQALPAVRYLRAEWALVHEVDRLRRVILAHDIAFVVLDSIAFGCDGPPEAAESAAAYFRAVRQLRVGALLLAHQTKGENGDQRPFGSVFWHNGARASWYLKRSEAEGDQALMTLGCFHRKSNSGPLQPARGLRVAFKDQGINITPTDLATHEDFAGRLPLWQRLVGELRHGPKTVIELATATDAKVDTVERIIRRHRDQTFLRLVGGDGITRFALAERRPA